MQRHCPGDGDLFAQAHPERVLIEEEFHYEQEISANRWTRQAAPPSGHIDIRLPYDGVHHLPRRTAKALTGRLRGQVDDVEATIGHLVLTDHRYSDLTDHLPLDSNHGAIPVRVPVRSTTLTDTAELTADRHEYRWELHYAPDPERPQLIPLELTADIEDNDTSDLREIVYDLAGGPAQQEFVERMTRLIAFRPALTLTLRAFVSVSLPRHRSIPRPVLRRVAVQMPAMTSLSSLKFRLSVGGEDHPVHYDPEHECLEWFDVTTEVRTSDDDTSAASTDRTDRRMFHTAEMRLDIDQPGELFAREEVAVHAEVEMLGLLLSGMQARLFDVRGRRRRTGRPAGKAGRRGGGTDRAGSSAFAARPTAGSASGGGRRRSGGLTAPAGADGVVQRTVVRTRCDVSLRDAFARRAFRPHQSLHFDEIIPARERVADVDAVLTSLGFTTAWKDLGEKWEGRDPDELLWWVHGERGDQVTGAGKAEIWIVVRGRRHRTRRQSERVAGTTYTTHVPTGELELFVRGTTLGDSTTLMEQMNALHRLLKERFRPMRSHR